MGATMSAERTKREDAETAFRFTKQSIEAIPPGPPRGKWYREGGKDRLVGFFLMSYPASKVFHVRVRVGSSRQILRVGRFGELTVEQARTKARELLATATLGDNPGAEAVKRRTMPTVKKWTETYLEEVSAKKKSPREDERFLALAAKRWSALPLDGLTRSEIFAYHALLGKKHATAANRFLASLRACLSEAVRREYLPTNPAKGIRHHRENQPRRRTLTPDEMIALAAAIVKERERDPFAAAALRMLIETGARLSEVLGARWEDVDLDAALWRLPTTKSGREQFKPLSAGLVAHLRRLPHLHGCDFVVVGGSLDKPRCDLRATWERAKTDAAKTAPTIADVHIHDLRRTFGLSVAMSDGLHVASKLLGHSSVGITERVYAPLGVDPLRSAIERHAASLPFAALTAAKAEATKKRAR